jgi:hypothetical protein
MLISDGPTYLMMLNWLQKSWKKGILIETIKGYIFSFTSRFNKSYFRSTRISTHRGQNNQRPLDHAK